MPVILISDDRVFLLVIKLALQLWSFIAASFRKMVTIQLATPNAGYIYSENAMLIFLGWRWHTTIRRLIPSKLNATQRLLERNLVIGNLRKTQSAFNKKDTFMLHRTKNLMSYIHLTYRISVPFIFQNNLTITNLTSMEMPYQLSVFFSSNCGSHCF